jgi:hypothetical protein
MLYFLIGSGSFFERATKALPHILLEKRIDSVLKAKLGPRTEQPLG